MTPQRFDEGPPPGEFDYDEAELPVPMFVVSDKESLRGTRATDETASWGFVPTMGALHEGHLALVRRARAENDFVVVSLFVNPAQFDRASDLGAYPRQLEADLELLEEADVDLVFTPQPNTLYPQGFDTWVVPGAVAEPLEGASRSGHFRGVATVVAKLFHLVRPTRAYFGQKDAQQVAVIRKMVDDLDFGVELVVCPTVREEDGLAMSSRNARLTADERRAAPVVYRALTEAAEALAGGERDADRLRTRMRQRIEAEPLARIDYVSVADPASLAELDRVPPAGEAAGALLSLAVFFGDVRLIDNVLVGEGETAPTSDREQHGKAS